MLMNFYIIKVPFWQFFSYQTVIKLYNYGQNREVCRCGIHYILKNKSSANYVIRYFL